MSDDRLFASNNAIGRRWYFLNMIILAVISFVTYKVFTDYITPNIANESYVSITNWILYFAYLIYLITFFALIERRLFDVCGRRDTQGYKTVSLILQLIILFQIITLAVSWFQINIPISLQDLQQIAGFLGIVFLGIIFFLGFIKGKISNLSYEEYRKQIKYK